MNVTILRRAFWLIAVMALGYTVFAFWEWRLGELIISAGLFVICIPIDLFLAREEREHRARARSPFGPIQSGLIAAPAEKSREAPDVPWWRHTWLLSALSPLLLIAAVPFADRADAIVSYPRITVTVVWTGDPQCVAAHGPNGSGGVEDIAMCSPEQWWTQSYRAPAAGQWIGVDPEMSGAETLSCTLAVNGTVILDDYAGRGDGTEVTCLGRWS